MNAPAQSNQSALDRVLPSLKFFDKSFVRGVVEASKLLIDKLVPVLIKDDMASGQLIDLVVIPGLIFCFLFFCMPVSNFFGAHKYFSS